MEHLKQETTSGAQLNLDALYQVCPQCFTESKDPKTGEIKHTVDFEKLRLLLGDNIAEGDERYDFTWVGKRAALQEAAKPIRKTLRPCPEESVDWDNTKNLYIEGDNLEVLKLLQNSYMGKVKMIYIDPPYNTGNDFVYQDDFQQTKKDFDLFSGDVTEEGERLVKNTESNGRFHSDWCSMMYSRLMLARTLLTEDGVIFISIDDNESNNLSHICNEVFGESNYVTTLCWRRRKTQANLAKDFSRVHEYIYVYSKSKDCLIINRVPYTQEFINKAFSNNDNDPKGPYQTGPLARPANSSNKEYTLTMPNGRQITAKWSCSQETFNQYVAEKRLVIPRGGEGMPRIKIYLSELPGLIPNTWLDNVASNDDASRMIGNLFGNMAFFDYSKPIELLEFLMNVGLDKNSIILDFFSGSATTAHAVIKQNAKDGGNRKYILVQLPEKTEKDSIAFKAGFKNICEIGKERIRRAGKLITNNQKSNEGDLFAGEQRKVDVGFRVFKCADSNMKDVYYTPAEYSQELLLGLEDNIKEDRNDLDLLFGCMLDWGVTLDLPLRTEKVDGVTIHIVNEGDLVACFDQNIPETAIDRIAALLPMRVVLRDSCFKEAKEKMNFFEIFKQRTGWSEDEVRKNVKVI